MTEGEKEEARAAKENLAQEQGEDKVEEEVVSDDDEAGRRQYKKSNQFKTHLKSSQVPLFINALCEMPEEGRAPKGTRAKHHA